MHVVLSFREGYGHVRLFLLRIRSLSRNELHPRPGKAVQRKVLPREHKELPFPVAGIMPFVERCSGSRGRFRLGECQYVFRADRACRDGKGEDGRGTSAGQFLLSRGQGNRNADAFRHLLRFHRGHGTLQELYPEGRENKKQCKIHPMHG